VGSGVNISAVGVGALLAAQRALSTTGHNIANASTEGYSRQRVLFQTSPAQFSGGVFLGQGVQVQSVERIVDAVANRDFRTQISNHGQVTSFLDYASRVDNLLAPGSSGLSGVLADFFSGVQNVTQDPASSVLRESLLGQAETLTNRFSLLDSQLRDIGDSVDSQLSASVAEVNRITAAIADINTAVVGQTNRAGQPNDLLDRRDNLVRELAQQVNVSTVLQDDGALNVFAGSGQTLVLGGQETALSIGANVFDAQRGEVLNSAGVIITGSLAGGKIGAAVDFRTRVLDPSINALGRVAVGLAESFNAQHQLGLDANGSSGGTFFNSSAPRVSAHSGNSGGTATGAYTDANALTTSDYRLTFDGANAYSLVRLADGQSSAINTGGTSPFTANAVDGFALTITAGAAVGDSFLIRPTADAAATIDVALFDPSAVAAASPVRAQTPLSNVGTAALSGLTANGVTNLPLTGPPVNGSLTLTYASATNQLTLVPDPLGEGPLTFDPTVDSGGRSYTLLGGDLSITLSGVPVDGDSFVVEHNTGGVGDNTNAVALAAIQDATVLSSGTATVQDAFGALVFEVGAATRDAQVNESAFGALLDQARSRRESISGVNLDEEAANLLRFQQAYQASARLVSVADDLFQTLLRAVRG
jgi:flagellar hook-associated protein 1 FlgK